MRVGSRVLASALLITLVAGCPSARSVVEPTAPGLSSVAPRLVVLVVVDQLPAWSFERRRHLFTGGMARLLREGAVVPRAEYPYAYPHTAVGHAALGTGAVPAQTGVIANTWFRRAEAQARPAEYDPASPLFALDGTPWPVRDDGASGRALRVPGLAESLRAHTGGKGRSVAISLKPRATAFMTGQRPDIALWYEEDVGGFTTSAYYGEALPTWLPAFNAARPVTMFDQAVWTAADPELLARETGTVDDALGEGSGYGYTTTFPHRLADNPKPAKAALTSPFGDALVTDAAIAAVRGEQLGQDAVPDFLAVSYSSHDFVAHNWGQESWETLDLLMRLDAQLGRLFDVLDVQLGAEGYAVVFTSDHGATPLVERAIGTGARRIAPSLVEDTAEVAATAVLGAGDWIAAVSSLGVYATPALAAQPADVRRTALSAISSAVAAIPGISAAGVTADMPPDCHLEPDARRRVCASLVHGESGDVYIVPAPGVLVTEYRTGTSHDTPSPENWQVPLIFRGPPVRLVPGEAVSMLSVAPTLAHWLGVPAPAAATGKSLALP